MGSLLEVRLHGAGRHALEPVELGGHLLLALGLREWGVGRGGGGEGEGRGGRKGRGGMAATRVGVNGCECGGGGSAPSTCP